MSLDASAFIVKSPRDGGQSIIIKSYSSLISATLCLSLVSLSSIETSSISAPASDVVAGITLKFLNSVFESKYKDLFTTVSKTLNSDGSACIKKALVGNLNLSVNNDDSLASKYLPKEGFAIQGSVRCHGETAIFKVDHKEYEVSISIFMDLYTQVDNILEYEKVSGNVITKEYSLNGYDNLIMCDVRSLLSYKKHYKELTNLVGKARVIELYNHIKDVIRSNYSE